MKLTGTHGKKMSVGSNMITGKEFEFNFKSFTFPSCKVCNDNFAVLESKVKPIIEKILIDDFIDKSEIILLLDWFDKVRIGLHLGVKYLNNNEYDLEPKYYINDRVGFKDRFLAITNCYDGKQELRWTGVNSYLFLMSPTTFTLKINNVIFTNCSSDFIVSKQLGFPYPAFFKPKLVESKEIDILLNQGKSKLSETLFKSTIYSSPVLIAQPIFKQGMKTHPQMFNNDYVRNNSINYEEGIGEIFVYEKNDPYVLEDGFETAFYSDSKKPKKFKFNAPTINFQIEIFTFFKYYLSHLSKEQKESHMKAAKYLIESSLEQVKHYNY